MTEAPTGALARSRELRWGLLLVMLAAVTWGTTGTTSRLLASHAQAGPLLVGFMRMAVAAPLLLPAARLVDGPPHVRGPAFLTAGACMAAYQVCFFSAVPRAGVAATALLAICSAPLMIAVLALAILREQMTRRTLLALAGGVAGTGLLVSGGGHTGHDFVPGAALALGAGLSYALYAVVTKSALGTTQPLSLAALTFTTAAVLLLPVLILARPSGAVIAQGWPLFLYLGAVPTALAYGLYTTGLRRTTATSAGIAGLLEPLTATVLGIVVFGESLGALGAVGAALLLGALVVLSLPENRLESK